MARHIVVEAFVDLQDNNYKYHAGDIFPRCGVNISESRIKELSTDKNRRKVPLIKLINEGVSDRVEKDMHKEAVSVTKKEPRNTKTGESTPKNTKAKGSTKKAQGDI